MDRLFHERLALALALLAGGCEPEPDEGRYGDCDADWVETRARLHWDDEIPGSGLYWSDEGASPALGVDTLCCIVAPIDEETCLDEGARAAELDEPTDWEAYSAFYEDWGACLEARPPGWSPSNQQWDQQVTCGPAWVDGLCCIGQSWELRVIEDAGDDGRPFLVRSHRRRAPVVARSDWSAALHPAPPPASARAALAVRWVAAGRAEHASVAAFARFALALLHLGAPSELVAAAHRAALDEVRHARACFALASAYSGEAVGPDRLDVSGALDGELDPERFTRTLVAEGCIGETLAALEAAEAARRTVDPVVRGVLGTIAADEARHAALAWRTLRWMVRDDPALRRVARHALAWARPRNPTGVEGLEAFGCLSGAARAAVARTGRRVVVHSLAEAALGSPKTAPAVALA